jgi:hypothetical protein
MFQDLLRKLQEDSLLPFDFAEGTLYLDPDIIDLTMIPPPITPDEVSILGSLSELKLEMDSGFCSILTQINTSNNLYFSFTCYSIAIDIILQFVFCETIVISEFFFYTTVLQLI